MSFLNSSSGVLVRLSGGLGNQLFQIVAAYELAKYLNIPAVDVDSRFLRSYGSPRDFEVGFILKHLAGVRFREPCGLLMPISSRLRLAKIFNRELLGVALVSSNEKAAAMRVACPKLVVLDGYFQDPALLFSESARLAVSDAVFRESADVCSSLFESGRPTVGVHIRKGDYLTGKAASIYKNIDLDYYRKCLVEFSDINPLILVFSDDKDICRDFAAEVGGVDMRSEKLALASEFVAMLSCDHLIIANSTFSWWAAYLGYREGKRVFCPREWFVDARRNVENKLLLSNFTLV